MRSFLSLCRVLVAGLVFLAVTPVLAEDASPEAAWQKVITGQIEAFRHGDAPEAFAYAGAGFQQTFPNAVVFFEAIIASGYAPIMESKSHTFGPFERTGQDGVAQVVKFVGPHQELYEAVYMLVEEADGWRVQGVSLGQPQGIGI
jgi:Domain of unknown function (DUF4864)